MSEKKFHKFKDGRIVILQSVASGKSLRILEDGSVDGRGQDGQWARFKVHVVGPGHVKVCAFWIFSPGRKICFDFDLLACSCRTLAIPITGSAATRANSMAMAA
jgi:hypothetical protein